MRFPTPGRIRARAVSVRKRLRYTIRAGNARKLSALTSTFAAYVRSKPVDPLLVFYESSAGAGMICNPLAIFRTLLADPSRAHLRHVWSINSPEEQDRLTRLHREHRNVTFVLRDSDEYLRALATAGHIVQNTSYPSYFAKRPGQVCVNTWHSTTVKKLGYDVPDGNIQTRNVIRSILISDFLVSPNPFMTRIFRESYRLQDLFPGKLLEMGYPRNDLTLNTSRDDAVRELQAHGVTVDPAKKIILYAPTWRGPSVSEVQVDTDQLLGFRDELLATIDTDSYQVLIKPHAYTHTAMSDEDRASGNYIPRQLDTNTLLAAVDILISDYSSVYFDFLLTDRPVLFYIPDQEEYAADRGVYFSFDELPGPVSEDTAEIASWINRIDDIEEQYRERLRAAKAWACGNDDGHAAERVVSAVFDRARVPGIIEDFLPPAKPRLLFYVSGFGQNGVSSAFRALVKRIDLDAYDVTVWGMLQSEASRQNFRALSGVRAMPRFGTFALTRWEAYGIEYATRYGLNGPLSRVFRPQRALEREYRRSFGDADFDYIIDFSGYGALYPTVLRVGAKAKKIVWQHQDLAADIRNGSKRKLKNYRSNHVSLTGMRDVYAAFDAVVSCGSHVMEVNRERLSTRATAKKFTYVDNMVEADRVRSLISEEPPFELPGHIVLDAGSSGGASRALLVPDSPPSPESDQPYVKFVTVGRLSPEKNHEALIRGFARFAKEYDNARLYIVGGGDLEAPLTSLCTSLGLDQLVTLTGHVDNPFALARQCDCFILPSLYEGFGLVVPEMRMLGLPIILADFDAAASVSVPNGQHTIGTEPADIYGGLKAYVDGRVPTSYEFDVDAYNDEAYQQFERLLGRL
ncbi:MAG: glycosyltransferase [Arachnia sp.]